MASERGKERFMSTALKLMLLPALVVAFSVGVALAATGGSDDGGPAPLPASSSTTIESGTTSTERGTTAERGTTTVGDGNDISGPCDEAEHANDPRCTGEAPVGSSGPGPGRHDDRGGDDDRSGRSGPDNSGPGSRSSGPGSDGGDHGDDD
jgi:hypothetical protein